MNQNSIDTIINHDGNQASPAEIHPVPAGNARIGDRVRFRPHAKAPWEDGWTVARIGIVNEHGYPLDIEIAQGDRRAIVAPFFSGVALAHGGCPGDDRPMVLIFPPDDELPESVREALAAHPNLRAIRDPRNGDLPSYRLLCEHCLHPVWVEWTTRESADLSCWSGDGLLGTSGPCVEDCQIEARCECRAYPDGLTIDMDRLG